MKNLVALFTLLLITLAGCQTNPVEAPTSSPAVTQNQTPAESQSSQSISINGYLGDLSLFSNDHLSIEADGIDFILKSNGLPDHETGAFPNNGNPNSISAQNYQFRIPASPQIGNQPTNLELNTFGIALNGVVFDPGANEYWNNNRNSGWRIEALSGALNLGLDFNNAHVQPTGAYHYHGQPTPLIKNESEAKHSSLIGFAADGFPIYGEYGYSNAADPTSSIKKLKSSYKLIEGTRPSGPGGTYDGTYVQDYEYIKDLGDLDECNGRTGITPEFPQGTYHYYITSDYPYIPRCFAGTPDQSFLKGNKPPQTKR